MLRFFFYILIVLFPTLLFAQGKRYHIKATFPNGSTATSITIGENKIAIKENAFEVFGYTPKNELASLVNSNGASGTLWLMPGEYELELVEENAKIKINKLKTAPALTKDYLALENYKNNLAEEAIANNWHDDSVACKFSRQLWAYAQKVKSNEVLDAFINQLTNKPCDVALLKKLATLQKNQKLPLQQQQQARLQKGKIIEGFVLKNQNDSNINLHSLNAKYILLDFWATWCGPCRRKHPLFLNLYNKYKTSGFEIVSVSLDDNKVKWQTAITQDKMTWINVSELKGWKSKLVERFGISKLPFNILLNSKFEIITTDASIGVIEAFLKTK